MNTASIIANYIEHNRCLEHEYNRSIHSEIATTPLARFLEGPAVTRPCPDSAALRLAFTRGAIRTQKKSDGSIVIAGRRFEVPNCDRSRRGPTAAG